MNNHLVTIRNIWITMSALCSGTGMNLKVHNRSTAACDGKNMYIPKQWVYTKDPLIQDILLGITVHEAMGHGRYTNFDKYLAFANTTSNMGSGILNIFEDIYVETMCNKSKPGAGIALADTVTVLVKKDFFGTPESFVRELTSKPAGLIISGLLNLCRARLLPGQDLPLAKNVEALEPILDMVFGPLWKQIWNIAKYAAKSTSTEDSIDLAKQVLALIAQTASEQPQPKQQKKGEPDTDDPSDGDPESGDQANDNDTDDSQSEGEGDDTQGDSKSGKASSAPVKADDEPQSGEDSDSGADELDSSSGKDDDESDVSSSDKASQSSGDAKSEADDDTQAVKDATEAAELAEQKKAYDAAKAISGSENQQMPTTELSEMASEVVDQTVRGCADNSALIVDLAPRKVALSEKARQIATAVRGISDDLQDALLAETRCVRSNRMVGKRLNGRLLSRIRMGNPNVFIRKDIGEGLSTAVSLLIDDSGSMGGLSEWTNGLCFGLGDILDEFEVPMEIVVYSDTLAHAKHFEDDWTNFRKQGKMVSIGGGTVTGGAAQYVVAGLACRTEDRRLLILATDGDTGDMDRLESVYAEATHQGIEIASIMLGRVIPKIQQLANRFGFEAISCNNEAELGKYVLSRILDAI